MEMYDDHLNSLENVQEDGLNLTVDTVNSSRSSCFYNKELKLVRSFVTSVLTQYVKWEKSVSKPVKCIDVFGKAGTCGLLWKKLLEDEIEVEINNPLSVNVIRLNAINNNLSVGISCKDPCIALHSRGYNFIYLDCSVNASYYFDAAFRNLSRNGILVLTTRNDCSMHGNNPDPALRRYGGRITRTFYFQELGIRLVLAAMARSAVKYMKTFTVLCCLMYKSTFTIVVMLNTGFDAPNKTMNKIRLLKHCMVCEERAFYPPHQGFPLDPSQVKLGCDCLRNAPGNVSMELGPLWADAIFDVTFIEQMLLSVQDISLKYILNIIAEEARCSGLHPIEHMTKKINNISAHPPFYYNLHKHHPHLSQLMKVHKLIEAIKIANYRASKTHFDKLAVRTDAPLCVLFDIMKKFEKARGRKMDCFDC